MGQPILHSLPGIGRAKTVRNLAESDAGAAILEFVLVLPLLLALLGGAFELGRALLFREAMIEAVRGGARYLARVPNPSCLDTCSPGAARAVAMTRASIAENTGLLPVAISVSPQWEPGSATVTMQARLTLDSDMLRFVGLGPLLTLSASHQEPRIAE